MGWGTDAQALGHPGHTFPLGTSVRPSAVLGPPAVLNKPDSRAASIREAEEHGVGPRGLTLPGPLEVPGAPRSAPRGCAACGVPTHPGATHPPAGPCTWAGQKPDARWAHARGLLSRRPQLCHRPLPLRTPPTLHPMSPVIPSPPASAPTSSARVTTSLTQTTVGHVHLIAGFGQHLILTTVPGASLGFQGPTHFQISFPPLWLPQN